MIRKPFQLTIDAHQFQKHLALDIQQALKKVWVQTLTYEADKAGHFLSNLLTKSKHTDRRLIVDQFYRIVINDQFLYTPSGLLNKTLWNEFKQTKQSLLSLKKQGVQVKEVNPTGILARKIVRRNHKKIICIDNTTAYVGGINFSEHNFSWHDFMLRITDPKSIDILNMDIEDTWKNQSKSYIKKIEKGAWLSVNGYSNPKYFSKLIKLMTNAKTHIKIYTPYLSPPFITSLIWAAKRGVRVDLITSPQNNWPLFSG